MKQYVLGFRFSSDRQWVVLIEKRKPAWQFGRLNGIGGKIEANEAPIDAMVREFEEETGLETTPNEWAHALTMEKEGEFTVYVFASVGDINDCHTMEEEEVLHANTFELPIYVIPNLRWIIPMLLDPELALPITIPFVESTTACYPTIKPNKTYSGMVNALPIQYMPVDCDPIVKEIAENINRRLDKKDEL